MVSVGATLAVAYLIDTWTERPRAQVAGAPPSGEALEVTRMGARGDGHADDTEAFRRALADSRVVHVAAGTYRVSIGPTGSALELNRPGAQLVFAPGAVLVLDPTHRSSSTILKLSAPDCTVRGGTLVGDLTSAVARTGEWGHGVTVVRGADRTLLDGVTVRSCWGDGIYIGGNPAEVVVLNCVSDGNRRQGLSIVGALQPLVIGGRYTNTGRVRGTGPSAGIDIEPNSGTGDRVIGATVRDVVLQGNQGSGLIVSGGGGPAQATLVGVVASDNRGRGFDAGGAGAAISLRSCRATRNSMGFRVDERTSGAVLTEAQADDNTSVGFEVDGPRTQLTSSSATGNGSSGIRLGATARGTVVRDCQVRRNNRASAGGPEVDVAAQASALRAVTISAGAAVSPAASGLVLRATAIGTTVQGSTPTGFSSGRAVIDERLT